MNTTTQNLADALRATLDTLAMVRSCAEYDAHANIDECAPELAAARATLAAYDAAPLDSPQARDARSLAQAWLTQAIGSDEFQMQAGPVEFDEDGAAWVPLTVYVSAADLNDEPADDDERSNGPQL